MIKCNFGIAKLLQYQAVVVEKTFPKRYNTWVLVKILTLPSPDEKYGKNMHFKTVSHNVYILIFVCINFTTPGLYSNAW